VQVDVLNGVNLDMLGRRDPAVYGGITLSELETKIYGWGSQLGCIVRCRQTNHEGEYIEWCHDAVDRGVDGVVVNPGAWSHYSWAIRDAIQLIQAPIVEVHVSNVDEREDWRRHSVLEGLVAFRVVGKGPEGYREALEFLVRGT
jgi:3-dehydroquinate dehydratase II